MADKKYKVLSLFSGAGGLDLGFKKAGFEISCASECWEPAAATHEKNFPGTILIRGDIRDKIVIERICTAWRKIGDFNPTKNGSFDIIIGGFPCQSYSFAGDRNPLDTRNQLYEDYIGMIQRFKPKMFVMENVKGILSAKRLPRDLPPEKLTVLKEMLAKNQRRKNLGKSSGQRSLTPEEIVEFQSLAKEYPAFKAEMESLLVPVLHDLLVSASRVGYNVTYCILNASDFGSPQSRNRIFIVGIRNDLLQVNPSGFLFPEPNTGAKKTAGDAIGDLIGKPEKCLPNHVFTKHSAEFVHRISGVKPGTTMYKYVNAWRRLDADKPAPTLKENHGASFIHFSEDRVITPREMARLMDFPDDFVFEGSKSNVIKQIGNAVPVKLAEAVALSVKKYLDEINDG